MNYLQMKLISAAFLGFLTCAAPAQNLTFERNFKVGDKTIVDVHVTVNSEMPVDSTSEVQTVVTKVYPDGSADETVQVLSSKVKVMGQEHDVPTGAVTTIKISKYGSTLGGGNSSMQMGDMSSYLSSFRDGLTVGKSVSFDTSAAKPPANRFKGTITLSSVVDGVGTLNSDMQIWSPAMGDTPMHSVVVEKIDTVTHQLISSTADVTGFPADKKITSVHFEMTTKK